MPVIQLARIEKGSELHCAADRVATTGIGVVMAYRFSQRPMVATVCLLAGIALPTVLLWIYK